MTHTSGRGITCPRPCRSHQRLSPRCARVSLDAATIKFRKIAEWETGESLPSYSQLERLAEWFKVPVAVFFPDPPDLPSLENTFRTLTPDQVAEIPPRIRLLLRKARAFQIGLEELCDGHNQAARLITRELTFEPSDNIERIAVELRDYLGVTLELQFSWGSTDVALKEWRRALLDVGVYVFKDQFREPQFSGFCLYDDEFPIIYVNNSTAKTRQIFTMFHELGHWLFHTSGVDCQTDDFAGRFDGDKQPIEVICNRLAACLLVPESSFDAALEGKSPTAATAAELAQLFGVSRESIYRKFLDRGQITNRDYERAAEKWARHKHQGTGGDYFKNTIAYLGIEYIDLAFQKFYQNRMTYDQLADILDTKPKNLSRLEEVIAGRRA